MRDLSAFDELPSEAQLRARIPRPERFRPEPRVLARATLQPRADGFFDLTLAGRPPRRVHALVAEAHRAMDEGASVEEVIARASPLWHDGRRKSVVGTLLRSYYMSLAREGLAEIPFEEPPALFGGRFARLKTLGRGGMGIAHLCADREQGDRLVVVKHAWGWSTPIERAERTSRREALALGLLDHPLVPGLVATFEEEGLLHMARLYAPGRPLGGSRDGTAGLPSARRLAIFRDMCEAIAHVHERGLLYLDVKPDNFVLGEDGRARLIDLGLCRPAREGGLPLRSPIGSRGYVAPEVTKRRVALPASDVYGLGRVLFQLASGARPRTKHDGAMLRDMLVARGAPHAEAQLVAWLADEAPERRPALDEVLARLDAIQEATRVDAVAV